MRVPEDVSTVGFDGLGDGLDLLGLATLRLPVAEVARGAVARMEELLARAQEEAEGPPPGERPDARPSGLLPAASPARHTAIAGSLVPGRTLAAPPEPHRA